MRGESYNMNDKIKNRKNRLITVTVILLLATIISGIAFNGNNLTLSKYKALYNNAVKVDKERTEMNKVIDSLIKIYDVTNASTNDKIKKSSSVIDNIKKQSKKITPVLIKIKNLYKENGEYENVIFENTYVKICKELVEWKTELLKENKTIIKQNKNIKECEDEINDCYKKGLNQTSADFQAELSSIESTQNVCKRLKEKQVEYLKKNNKIKKDTVEGLKNDANNVTKVYFDELKKTENVKMISLIVLFVFMGLSCISIISTSILIIKRRKN